jgi:hypothetical protein
MSDAAAELARIRRAVVDAYGEDYGSEDVAADVERLLGHLADFETNMGRILGAKSEAIERENRAAGLAIAKYGIAKERAEKAEAEVERLLKFTATCTCGTPGLDYEGPQADCVVHGAVRAYNESQTELERLRTWAGLLELLDEHWPEDIFPTEPDSEARDVGPRIVSLLRWVERLRGELDQAHVDRSNDARRSDVRWQRVTAEIEAERDKVREAEGATARDESVIAGIYNGLGIALRIVRGGCRLCGGAGVVRGTGEPETNTTGEPCDCVLLGRSAACCDMHNVHCEPPSELCCYGCTEAGHPEHPRGVACVLDTPGGES